MNRINTENCKLKKKKAPESLTIPIHHTNTFKYKVCSNLRLENKNHTLGRH